MTRITDYTALTLPAAGDVLPVVDISDTSMSAAGTTKKIAIATLLGTAVLQPSGDTSGVTDAANLAAILAAGNVAVLAPGSFYVAAGTVTLASAQYIHGPGRTACTINGTGTGDIIRIVGTNSTSSLPGGGLSGFTVDGTSCGAGSAGIHAGDLFQLDFDAGSRNFTGTGSKNWWFDNQYTFTEQITGKIYSGNGTAGFVFDNSANVSGNATGSFDRFAAQMFLTGMTGDGVVFQNGAFIIDPVAPAGIYGNMVTGGASGAACIRITGSNGGGFSRINGGSFSAGVELRNAGGNVPSTILFGTRTSNNITDCAGIMDFSANAAFTASNSYAGTGTGSFRYDGPVYGDINLQRSAQLGSPAFNIGSLANNATINTKYTGLVRVITGSNVTGIILQGGDPDDWREVAVLNVGTGSITFDIAATSKVADGTSDVIAPNTGAKFRWSVDEALWYRL